MARIALTPLPPYFCDSEHSVSRRETWPWKVYAEKMSITVEHKSLPCRSKFSQESQMERQFDCWFQIPLVNLYLMQYSRQRDLDKSFCLLESSRIFYAKKSYSSFLDALFSRKNEHICTYSNWKTTKELIYLTFYSEIIQNAEMNKYQQIAYFTRLQRYCTYGK
jgi:hypothetical protein